MRTIKYLMPSWAILTLSILLFSCMDDDFRKDTEQGDGKSIQLQISAPENTIVNPLTKADQSNSQSVENLTILAFDNNGNILKAEYVTDGLSALGNTATATISRNLTVGEGAKGFVCVVANAGDLTSNIKKYSDLESLRFDLEGNNPKMIMFASKVDFNVDDSSYKVTAELVRIYSMVTVVVKRETDEQITITPQRLTLYNVPKEGRLTEKNLITKEEESVRVGETLDATVQNTAANYWNDTSHEGGPVLFLYENQQPNGFCMTRSDSKPDQTSKTPASFKQAMTDTQLLMSDVRSSFIQIEAGYKSTNSNQEGKITYRFFLGRDAYTNFDVSRNVHYKVTLTLTGNGGVDEATWRVETEDIPNKLNLSDIYVSYLAGSTSRLKITGDINSIESVKVDSIDNPNEDVNAGFTFAKEGTGDEYVAVITAASTNVHYYKNKVGKLIFTMNNGTKLSTNIYQVPRLVDPIAIYKKATNVAETKIELKEYDENQKKYVVLESIGPWEVKIDGTSDGDWFELHSADGKQSVRYSYNKTITGEGKVEFIYKPLSPNTNPDTQTDGARYGKILIKYHNKWCEHEIFLRQGYQPTTLGNEAWSLFNCIGLDSRGNPQITDFPTQTGWLFKGGCNYGMHPFKPGFMEGINGESKIKYSDEVDKYENTDATQYDFTRMDDELNNYIWMKKRQGPCPDGYKVADAYAYSTMVKNAFAYAGFVYDDDPVKGWEYGSSGDAVLLTYDNHCNPAKGIIFIEKNSTKNVFFGFGKGIMSGMNTYVDGNLVNEIGVGHRYRGVEYGAWGQSESSWGWLTVNNCNTEGKLLKDKDRSYGGWYWNSSPFPLNSQGGTHLGKVDFMYNLFSSTPFDIDVPTDPNDNGIHVNSNASFVRCVIDKNPDPNSYIKINAKFYRQTTDGTYKVLVDGVSLSFAVNGTSKQLKVNKGLVSEELAVLKGTADGTVVAISNSNWTAVQATLSDLKDPNKEIIMKDPNLETPQYIDIKAKIYLLMGNGQKSVLGGGEIATVTVTKDNNIINSFTVENGLALEMLSVPSSYSDEISLTLTTISGFSYKAVVTIGDLRNFTSEDELIFIKP